MIKGQGSELQRLQSLTETQAEQIKGLELQKGGHGEPCYYCGKACISISGNPAKWPIPLCHPDEPGVVKFHHVGCVSERLEQLASTRALKKSKESKV